MTQKNLFISLCLCCLTSCSYVQRFNPFSDNAAEEVIADKDSQAIADSGVSQQEIQSSRSNLSLRQDTGVEIVWQVPRNPVIAYKIFYGPNPDQMASETEVKISELETFEHPKQGKVYKYVLRTTTSDGDLYVSLQAKNSYGYGVRSKPFKVSSESR